MAADDVHSLLRQPGRLVVTPTNIAAGQSFPYGGTSLGYTLEGCVLKPDVQVEPLTAEDVSGVFDWLFLGGDPTLEVDLMQWDDDAVAKAFPGIMTSTGSSTGNKLVNLPGIPKGSLMSGQTGAALKILFCPDDARGGKFVLFRAAMPLPRESAEIRMRRADPLTLPLVFRAGRDLTVAYAGQRVVAGDRRDISL